MTALISSLQKIMLTQLSACFKICDYVIIASRLLRTEAAVNYLKFTFIY